MKAALYTRISAADVGRTTAEVLAELRRYAVEVRSWEVVAELADSGPGLRGRREALLSLLERIKAKTVSIVVTDSLARLCRNLSHLADLAGLLRDHGVDLVAVQELVDTTTLDGRARWVEATEMLAKVQHRQRSEAVRLARVKAAVAADDNWGRPIAVVNPLELAGYYLGRPGSPPLSVKKMSAKMNVSEGTLRKRIRELVEAGSLDPAKRERNLEAAGGLPRGGRPSRARLDEDEVATLWNGGESFSSMSRVFRCGKDRIRARVDEVRKTGKIDDELRAKRQNARDRGRKRR